MLTCVAVRTDMPTLRRAYGGLRVQSRAIACWLVLMATCGFAAADQLLATAFYQKHHQDTGITLPFYPAARFSMWSAPIPLPPTVDALRSDVLQNGQLATQDFVADHPSFAGLAAWLTDAADERLAFSMGFSYFYNGTFTIGDTFVDFESYWFGGTTLAGLDVTLIRMQVEQLNFWQHLSAGTLGVDARVRWEIWGNVPEPATASSLMLALFLRRRR